jgi:hypothetical protein
LLAEFLLSSLCVPAAESDGVGKAVAAVQMQTEAAANKPLEAEKAFRTQRSTTMSWNLLKLLRTTKSRRRTARIRARLEIEDLEQRLVMTAHPVATINVAQPGRVLSGQLLGVNTPGWDAYLGDTSTSTPDAQTVQLIKNAGLNLLRLSYGTGADEWHFNQEGSDGFAGSAALEGNLVDATGTGGVATINYGSGSPQEGAAYVAYLAGSVNDNTALGQDAQGQDWKTVSFWARLRSQTPQNNGDNLDFLRDGHPAPFNIHSFEVGNEVYFAGWDKNLPGAKQTADPAEYAGFVTRFASLAKEIDPQAQIGVSLGNPNEFDSWNSAVLSAFTQPGAPVYLPDFISDHFYLSDLANNDGGYSDQDLLLHTLSDPGSVLPNHSDCPANWGGRDAYFRSLLQNFYGDRGSTVQLFALEFNSDASSSTPQSYGLAHGLLFADAIGSLLNTSYTAFTPWDLRTDGALLGNSDATAYTPYPAYFAEQLASHLVHTGDQVLPASSDTQALSVYATERPDRTVEVMLINKSDTEDDNVTFNLTGFTPGGTAQSWQYGQAEGNALSENDHVAMNVTIDADGMAHFQSMAPAYSMTVLELAPVAGPQANPPTVAQPATADAVVNGTQVGLSVLGSDAAGEAGLTYTWRTVNAPAPVTFGANGSNAAKNTIVTFTAAGTYTFVATITNAAGLSTTSTVTVTVNTGVSALATFADVDDWGTGFTGYITLSNTGSTPINGWTLEFDFTGNISTDIWNAQIISHVGSHYVIQSADWNAAIAPGANVSFGFNADWGADQAGPINYVLNGVAILQI